MTLGESLRVARKAKRLTLKNVEAATGISNAYLSQIESGKIRQPRPDKLQALAPLYGISYDVLMYLAGYTPSGALSGAEVPAFILEANQVLTAADWELLRPAVRSLTEARMSLKALEAQP